MSGQITARLRERILTGAYAPGAPLLQDSIAAEFGVSKIPVREALVQLSAEGLVSVFAHRGFPPSSPVPGNTAPDSYVDDLAALIEELKLKDIALVGQSMGGWTCLDYALHEPGRVRALVMASTSGVIDFNQVDDDEIQQWSSRSAAALAELQSVLAEA